MHLQNSFTSQSSTLPTLYEKSDTCLSSFEMSLSRTTTINFGKALCSLSARTKLFHIPANVLQILLLNLLEKNL